MSSRDKLRAAGITLPEGAKAKREKKPKLPKVSEAVVQRQCLDLLAIRGVTAWRSNSRVFMVPGKGGKQRPMRAGLGKGSSDIIGLLPGGRFLAIECKRPGEKASEDQVLWMAQVNNSGGLARCVDSVERLNEILAQAMGEE